MTLHSYVTHEEGAILYNAAKYATKGIVEIGSAYGRSAIYLAQGSRDGNNIPVYCIDPWTYTERGETKDLYEQFLHNTIRYKDLITPIRELSQDVAKTFTKEFDVLFIDGGHDYEQVKLDWELWGCRIKSGRVLFHDIGRPELTDEHTFAYSGGWTGPRKVFETLEKEGHLIEEHGNLGRVVIGDLGA